MILDHYLKNYHFNEYHDILIDAAPEQIYPALKRTDFSQSKIIALLFMLRGFKVKDGTLNGFIKDGFVLLQEKENEEIVLGFVAQGTRMAQFTPETFPQAGMGDPKKGTVKGAWNFHLKREGSAQTRLSTETRVLCTGKRAKRLFSVYWFFVAPFSRWIRRIILRMIKRQFQ